MNESSTGTGSGFGQAPAAWLPHLSQGQLLPVGPRRGGAFTIRTADNAQHRQAARSLVGQRYAQRGYQFSSSLSAGDPDVLTLSAVAEHRVLGTLGMRFAARGGLNADQVFPEEMQALRNLEPDLCEFTQLALDSEVPSKQVLAALFHTAYLHAHRIRGAQMAVIEVNPRHVPYYRRMLGFKVYGEARMNLRVHAPAVLMTLDFCHAEMQVARYGGQPALAGVARTLYPFCFTPGQEQAILAELFQDTASAIAVAG